MRLLIMGAPGAGKGTQAVDIAEYYKIPTISTGDIFRANISQHTPLGEKVQRIISEGDYVPDELTEQIVADRLEQDDAKDGFLLDGFPRTMHQVKALDELLASKGQKLDAVISLVVDPEVLAARLMRRAEIEGRQDDTEETIRHRMKVYDRETKPLLDYYGQRGLLVEVRGEGKVDQVSQDIFEAVDVKVGADKQ